MKAGWDRVPVASAASGCTKWRASVAMLWLSLAFAGSAMAHATSADMRQFLDSDDTTTRLAMAEVRLEGIDAAARRDDEMELKLRHTNDPVVPNFPDMQAQGRADAIHGDLIFQKQEAQRIQATILQLAASLKARTSAIDHWLAACPAQRDASECDATSDEIRQYREKSRDDREAAQRAVAHAKLVVGKIGAPLGKGGTLLPYTK